jgi:hypothetical protein
MLANTPQLNIGNTQVSPTTFQPTQFGPTTVAPTTIQPANFLGAAASDQTAAMQAYQAQLAQQNAMMSGLFGLGGTLGAAGIKYGLV